MKRLLSRVIVGFIFVVIGAFFLAGSWYAYLDYTHEQKYEVKTSGKVTKKHFQTTADGGGNYYLDYSFNDANGNKSSGNNRVVTKQQWDILKDGDVLEIKHDKSNPKRNIPIQNNNATIVYAFFVFILGGLFSIFGIQRIINGFRGKSKT